MFILALNSREFPSYASLEKLHEGRLVVVWRPGPTSVGCSGMRWGWVKVFRGRRLELVLACGEREGDSGDVLSPRNVMESWHSLSVPWRVGGWGRGRRVHCLQRVILHAERRVWGGKGKRRDCKENSWAVTFHFLNDEKLWVQQKLLGTVASCYWDKFFD